MEKPILNQSKKRRLKALAYHTLESTYERGFFMKKLSKILSIVTALALVIMSINVVAVNAATITINGSEDTFKAYQIFSSSEDDVLADEDNGGYIAGNLAFATGLTEHMEAFIQALLDGGVTGLDASSYASYTAQDVADAIENAVTSGDMADNSSKAAALARSLADFFESEGISETGTSEPGSDSSVFDDLPVGYYVIVSTTAAESNIQPVMLQVLGGSNNEIEAKGDVTSIDKAIAADSADKTFRAGEEVPFELTITIPENVQLYEEYNLTITDTPENLTLGSDGPLAITVTGYKKSAPAVGEPIENTGSEYFSANVASNVLTITNGDSFTPDFAKDYEKIVISYTATTNADITHGNVGHNDVTLTYSNNPNDSTQTATDTATVNVYSVGLQIDKVDDDTQPLDGADFTLSYWNPEKLGGAGWEDGVTVTPTGSGGSASADRFTFDGLSEGWYKLEESETPAGYNKWAAELLHIETTVDPASGITAYTITAYNDYTDFAGSLVPGSMTQDDVLTFSDDYTSTGLATAQIMNNKGTSLPETGGMGTKIFYTLGGIFVVGAALLLVVKRRMATE